MNFLSKTISVILLLFLISCSVNENELDNQLERFLGKSFEGEFQILVSNSTFAFGDELSTLDVKFTEKGIKELIEIIPKKEMTVLENGWQYGKKIPLKSGFDFILISSTKNKFVIHIQFGNE